MANDGGYAYPIPADDKAGWHAEAGMSYRDAAAIAALQVVGPYLSTYKPDAAAKIAYDLAQAMVVEKAAREAHDIEAAAATKTVSDIEPSGDLPFREKDIRLGLILFRKSTNASTWTNCEVLTEEVDKMPAVAKLELSQTMENIASELRRKAVGL